MNEHLFLQQVVSFQRVTLESRNFIRLVGIKVMLKCTSFMENWIPVSEHWDDRREATFMTPFFFLDPSVTRWNDRRRGAGMTRREYWDDKRRGYLDDTIEIWMTGKGGAEITRRGYWSDRRRSAMNDIIGVGMDML